MSLKLLLVSVSGALINSDGQIFVSIAQDIAKLARQLAARGVTVVLWSNRAWTVNGESISEYMSKIAGIPIPAHGYHIDGMPARQKGNSASDILAKYGAQTHETLLVGGKQEDMRAGVNNKLLLIRPDWHGQQMDYGFSVTSVDELARFCFVFGLRQHPIFWRQLNGALDTSAAGPFSTYIPSYAVFGDDAKAAKKGGGHPDFWFYLTVSSLYFSGLMDGVNYICSYPGHGSVGGKVSGSGIAETLVRLGNCFNKPYYHDLIVRHTIAQKSQEKKAADRLFMTQLNSIHLQAKPHKNLAVDPNKSELSLKNKAVLVVDDFCTSGRSLEAARVYLEAAGAKVRLYSWLKTINTDYQKIWPAYGAFNPYAPMTFATEPASIALGYKAGIVASGAPVELDSIFGLYTNWNWSTIP